MKENEVLGDICRRDLDIEPMLNLSRKVLALPVDGVNLFFLSREHLIRMGFVIFGLAFES